jgi:O-methyltransferase involved in polyketide biosynthesis
VPIDFDRDDLHGTLRSHGFERGDPAFFILGRGHPYLSTDGVNRTLTFVAECAPGSELVFTYLRRGALDGTHAFPGTSTLLRTLARAREPFTFGFDPTALPTHLAERGLALVWESPTLARGPQALPGAKHFRIALARVPPFSATESVESPDFSAPAA